MITSTWESPIRDWEGLVTPKLRSDQEEILKWQLHQAWGRSPSLRLSSFDVRCHFISSWCNHNLWPAAWAKLTGWGTRKRWHDYSFHLNLGIHTKDGERHPQIQGTSKPCLSYRETVNGQTSSANHSLVSPIRYLFRPNFFYWWGANINSLLYIYAPPIQKKLVGRDCMYTLTRSGELLDK